jgi:hypothetical protein
LTDIKCKHIKQKETAEGKLFRKNGVESIYFFLMDRSPPGTPIRRSRRHQQNQQSEQEDGPGDKKVEQTGPMSTPGRRTRGRAQKTLASPDAPSSSSDAPVVNSGPAAMTDVGDEGKSKAKESKKRKSDFAGVTSDNVIANRSRRGAAEKAEEKIHKQSSTKRAKQGDDG